MLFFSALVTEYKMDAKQPLLDSCCIIQAFPGKRTLLGSTPRIKKTPTNKKVGCRLKPKVVILCPPPACNRSQCCHRWVSSAGWSGGKITVYHPPAFSVCRVGLLIWFACCWRVTVSGSGEETELPLSVAARWTWLKRTAGVCWCGSGTGTTGLQGCGSRSHSALSRLLLLCWC